MSNQAFAPDAGAPTSALPVCSVDFETTYDDTCSIKPLGWDAYFRHEHFEAYLVAIKTSDGIEWVGHPADAPWGEISGHLWISHNASFDENLYRTARELGWWNKEADRPLPLPPAWHCTSDMAAYLGHPRSLKNACKEILNADLSKEVRTNMKGLRPPDDWKCINPAARAYWKPMTNDFWNDVLDYALDDSVWCLKLWETCAHRWPEQERWLSDHTRTIARRGIPVDIGLVQDSIVKLKGVLHGFEASIPWADTDALLSRAAFDRECVKHDLIPPKSLAKDSAEADQWLTENEPDHKWIYAYRNWRRANSLLKKVEAVERATREVDGHYRYFGGLMYCGAHTKRWCLPGSYEVLTKAGWSKLHRWDERDPILQWSEDGALVFRPATKVRFERGGPLNKCGAPNAAFACTPEHELPCLTSRKTLHKRTSQEARNTRFDLPVSGHFFPERPSPLTEDEVRFMVATQADGCWVKSPKFSGWSWRFRKERKIARFITLADAAGVHVNKVATEKGTTRFTLAQSRSPWWLTKKYDLGFLLTLGTRERAALLDELVYWDGNRPRNSKGFSYFSTDYNNAKAIATIAHTTGKAAHISIRTHPHPNWRDLYRVFIRDQTSVRVAPKHWSRSWTGKPVYCATTQTGYFLCRAPNGDIFVSGNSGSGGNLNLQNPPKEEMFGVKFRDFFRAPKGRKFVAIDLSQIEVRTLTWLTRDFKMLERIAKSPDIYQAFAVGFRLWDDEKGVLKKENNDLRNTVKPIVLGSGFGASAFAFADKERDQLLKEVRRKYDEGDYETIGREFLEARLKDTHFGPWWWKKAGRLLVRGAVKDVPHTAPTGREYTKPTPEWKAWAEHLVELRKKYEARAKMPIALDDWTWDWENVVVYAEAEYCVQLYRTTMPAVTKFWKKMERTLKGSVMDRHMEFVLPSGNRLTYKNVRRVKVKDDEDKTESSQILCSIVRNGRRATMKPWYGLLTENLAQSLARDVFGDGLRRLEEAGHYILWHTHDEAVEEVYEDVAENMLADGVRILQTPPDWIASLPVDAEGAIGDTYAECK